MAIKKVTYRVFCGAVCPAPASPTRLVSNVVVLGSSSLVLDVVRADGAGDHASCAAAVQRLCLRFAGFMGRGGFCDSFTLSADHFSVKNICASVTIPMPAPPASGEDSGVFTPDFLAAAMHGAGLYTRRPRRATAHASSAEFRALCISAVPLEATATTPKGSKHKGQGNCMLSYKPGRARGRGLVPPCFTGRIQGCNSLANMRALFDKVSQAVGLPPAAAHSNFERCVRLTNAVLCAKAYPADPEAAKLPSAFMKQSRDVPLPADGSSAVCGRIFGSFGIGNVLECVTEGEGV